MIILFLLSNETSEHEAKPMWDEWGKDDSEDVNEWGNKPSIQENESPSENSMWEEQTDDSQTQNQWNNEQSYDKDAVSNQWPWNSDNKPDVVDQST